MIDKIVEHPWEYIFSSARNYADKEGLVKVICLNRQQITVSWNNCSIEVVTNVDVRANLVVDVGIVDFSHLLTAVKSNRTYVSKNIDL